MNRQKRLTPPMLKVIKELAQGKKISDTAKKLKIPSTTIYNWTSKNMLFQKELDRVTQMYNEMEIDSWID